MRKHLGLILIVVSAICIVWIAAASLGVSYWIKRPYEKLQTSWNEDIHLLERSHKLPKQWNEIHDVVIKGDNSPVQEWLGKIKAPVKTISTGRYRLDVFFIHWIEGYRYGVVVQYNLVDLGTSNTIWELGRTYKLGIVY